MAIHQKNLYKQKFNNTVLSWPREHSSYVAKLNFNTTLVTMHLKLSVDSRQYYKTKIRNIILIFRFKYIDTFFMARLFSCFTQFALFLPHHCCFACNEKLSYLNYPNKHEITHTHMYILYIYSLYTYSETDLNKSTRHAKSFIPLTKCRKSYWLPYKKFFHS